MCAGMVDHPAKYPWSNYRRNALVDENDLVFSHELYTALGKDEVTRCEAYRALFNVDVGQQTIEAIREATNKSWVLGSDYFKEKIADKINRPMNPRQKGGDRKSKAYFDGIDRS